MANQRQSKRNKDEVKRMFAALADVGDDISSCGYDFGFFLVDTKNKKMDAYMNSHTNLALIGMANMLKSMADTKEELQDLIDKLTFIAGCMENEG